MFVCLTWLVLDLWLVHEDTCSNQGSIACNLICGNHWDQWRNQGLPGWAWMRKKMSKVWGKIRKFDRNLRKNEESGTLAHPGLWGWLRPWLRSCIQDVYFHVLEIYAVVTTWLIFLRLKYVGLKILTTRKFSPFGQLSHYDSVLLIFEFQVNVWHFWVLLQISEFWVKISKFRVSFPSFKAQFQVLSQF